MHSHKEIPPAIESNGFGPQAPYAHAQKIPNAEAHLHLEASDGVMQGRFYDGTDDAQLRTGLAEMERTGSLKRPYTPKEFRMMPGNQESGVFVTTGTDDQRRIYHERLAVLREREAIKRLEVARNLGAARMAAGRITNRERDV